MESKFNSPRCLNSSPPTADLHQGHRCMEIRPQMTTAVWDSMVQTIWGTFLDSQTQKHGSFFLKHFFCHETIHPFPNSHWLLVVVLRFCSYLEKIGCTDRDSFFEKKTWLADRFLFSRSSHALLWSAWLVSSF